MKANSKSQLWISYFLQCVGMILLFIGEPDDDGDDDDGDDEEKEDAHSDGAQQPRHHAVRRIDLIQIFKHLENHGRGGGTLYSQVQNQVNFSFATLPKKIMNHLWHVPACHIDEGYEGECNANIAS